VELTTCSNHINCEFNIRRALKLKIRVQLTYNTKAGHFGKQVVISQWTSRYKRAVAGILGQRVDVIGVVDVKVA
jgi:hypothetical protein